MLGDWVLWVSGDGCSHEEVLGCRYDVFSEILAGNACIFDLEILETYPVYI